MVEESGDRRAESSRSARRVVLALGANLPARDPLSGRMLNPAETLARAVELLAEGGFTTRAASLIYRTAPEGGAAGDPDFANAVIAVDAACPPGETLLLLKALEAAFGRDPDSPRLAARPLDLDLIDWAGSVFPSRSAWRAAAAASEPEAPLVLPHPRLHLRSFVLVPLAEILADWRHPVTGACAAALRDQVLRKTACPPQPYGADAGRLKSLIAAR